MCSVVHVCIILRMCVRAHCSYARSKNESVYAEPDIGMAQFFFSNGISKCSLETICGIALIQQTGIFQVLGAISICSAHNVMCIQRFYYCH